MKKREKIATMSLYDLMACETVTKQYTKYTDECYQKSLQSLPDDYKHSSMVNGTKCDLSFNQGQRDAFLHIRNVLSNIGIDIQCLIDERSDEMHQTHLDEQVMAKENEL